MAKSRRRMPFDARQSLIASGADLKTVALLADREEIFPRPL
jgi:hypothetical protein